MYFHRDKPMLKNNPVNHIVAAICTGAMGSAIADSKADTPSVI